MVLVGTGGAIDLPKHHAGYEFTLLTTSLIYNYVNIEY